MESLRVALARPTSLFKGSNDEEFESLCLLIYRKRYREKPDTFVGGPEEIRTLDFYNANVALSQLSYRPVNLIIITRDV